MARPAALLLASFLLPAVAPAARPKLHDGLRRDYKIRNVDPQAKDDAGSPMIFRSAEFSYVAQDSKLDGKSVYLVRLYQKTAEGDSLTYKFYIDPESREVILSESEVITREGKLLEKSSQYYGNHFLETKPKAIPMELLPFIIQYVDLEKGKKTKYYLTRDPKFRPIAIIVTVESEETITVPAGTYDCIRLRVEMSLETLPGFFKIIPQFIIKGLLSDFYIWVDKDSPHMMVLFRGKIESFSGPEKLQELIRVYEE